MLMSGKCSGVFFDVMNWSGGAEETRRDHSVKSALGFVQFITLIKDIGQH